MSPGRAEGRAWLAIAAVPFALWLAIALLALTHRPVPVNTGDALLDAYVQQVIDTELSPGTYMAYPPADRGGNPSWVRFWSDMEQRFGNDPRYYELRFSTSRIKSYITAKPPNQCYSVADAAVYESPIAGVSLPVAYSFLEAARDRGLATPAVYCALAAGYSLFWGDAAWDQVTTPSPARNAPVDEWQRLFAERREVIDKDHGRAERALLNDWQAAAPQSVARGMYLALTAAERGDYPAAKQALESCAERDMSAEMLLFPESLLWQHVAQGQPLQDKYVTGLVYWDSMTLSTDFAFLTEGWGIKLYLNAATEQRDLAGIEGLHATLQSLMSGNRPTILAMLHYLGTANQINDAIAPRLTSQLASAWQGRLTPEQLAECAEVRAKLQQMLQIIQTIVHPQALYAPSILPQSLQPDYEDFVEHYLDSRIRGALYASQAWEMIDSEADHVNGQLLPLIRELDDFDYTTLSWLTSPPEP